MFHYQIWQELVLFAIQVKILMWLKDNLYNWEKVTEVTCKILKITKSKFQIIPNMHMKS